MIVTGRVPDVRPYLKHAAVVVAPMRIARGIQNKVLEGMAMARPVVVTTKGLEGIDAKPSSELLVADTAGEMAAALLSAFDRPDLGNAARRRVLRDYGWRAKSDQLVSLVAGHELAQHASSRMPMCTEGASRVA